MPHRDRLPCLRLPERSIPAGTDLAPGPQCCWCARPAGPAGRANLLIYDGMDSGIDPLPDEATGARKGGHHVLFPRSRGFGWLPRVRLGPW